MLYGMPGTGKTELAKQLAVNSKRPIMNVDLSKLKGSYFGESEKRVSEIFRNYSSLISNSEITPILLLNEADGILRNRSEINANSTVSGTEHLIQTTFLNCLENAKGIIIATTNFITNLDDAYDRRFLFKLELQKPNEEVRIKLLKNKIQSLTDDQAKELARNYEITGAQIENVLRKSEISFVLNGKQADYSMIQAYFDEEICLQHKTKTKIGF
jgi:SpoVK/Ycf46/Vps4 family AAA+-type ATPase